MRRPSLLLLCVLAVRVYGAIDVPLRVRETAGVGRAGEVVRSGIPVPRSAGVLSTSSLAIVDASGAAVPAQFRVLARWNAGRGDANAPIQWLLVSFPANVAANGTATYRLIEGTNPAPAASLRLTRDGNRVTVDTGAATYVIDGAASSLFANGGTLTARVNETDVSYGSLRRVVIEDAGPVSAVVIVEGTYGPGLGSQRRYTFSAGSAMVIVRQTLANETTNVMRVRNVRDTFPTSLGAPLTARITGAGNAYVIESGVPAALIQRLRASRTAPSRYEIQTPAGTIGIGEKADRGSLELRGSAGTVAVALQRMHDYEPQALRAAADGTISIEIAADQTWLSARQALFATFAIGTSASAVWAPLNHPLRAWPDAAWFAGSDAVDPFPAGAVLPELARYDDAVRGALERTVAKREELGIHGLMTFGLYPRLWGTPIYSDEVDCGGGDPTPGEAWDDLYWCTTWTDYHNTTYAAAARAMRSGEVEWLDEITVPAALRVLYTQIFQCDPSDGYFYCGQAPAGYGAYRDDFNSSHAYFDNLQLYYWLTGDTAVVDTLERGSRSMRNYLCSRRPAAACQPHDPPIDEWANLTGRVASQWIGTFRFVGLASDDASYLEDYRSNLARAVTQQYVSVVPGFLGSWVPGENAGTSATGAAAETSQPRNPETPQPTPLGTPEPRNSGTPSFGFLLSGWRPITSSGRITTDQLWMTALYDLKNLDRLRRDTGDAPIGDPPLRPSEIIAAYARAIERFGPSLGWPNSFDVTFTGPRVGGTLQSVVATPGGGDPYLYDTGRSTLAGPVSTAAMLTGEPSLRAFARSLTAFAIDASLADLSPLGKLQGEYLARLHSAVAALAPKAEPRRRAVRH